MLPSIDSMLRMYTNRTQTKRDVQNVIEQYKALIYKFGPFVFNDGRSKDLLHLEGTIPVPYKGAVYNIPIFIYLMDTHPDNAPICYVTPTPDMQIKVSMHVDHNGKIYLPYLHDWNPLSSNLLNLIQCMVKAFGEVPPVFAKPREVRAPYPVQQPMYMPMPGTTSMPPYMSQMQHSQPPAVSTASSYPPQPPYPLGNNSISYPPYPSPSTALNNSNSGTITEEHIKASLLSAVRDKLKLKLTEDFAQCRAELDILKQTSMELHSGKTKIQDIMDKLNKEKTDLDRYINILKDREVELIKAINDLEEQGDIDVDEAVTTTAPLYKQILNAYAEEAATEDTIYYMGEALRRGVIDLDVFLKQVRSLSRKQFMLRALMQKCRTRAGLAG